jgi:carbonic anhydrase/acetyltransferase-like protein (isoleucine patch superfamily)
MEFIHNLYYQHPTALVYGKVSIAGESSLWPYSVIRAEINEVIIGRRVNIQDFVMIHVGEKHPVIIGENTSITHRVVIHGAKIGKNCLIGIGAILMDGCEIGDNSIVAPGALVRENMVFEPNSLIIGSPAKKLSSFNYGEANFRNALAYLENAKGYVNQNYTIWSNLEFRKRMEAGLNQSINTEFPQEAATT